MDDKIRYEVKFHKKIDSEAMKKKTNEKNLKLIENKFESHEHQPHANTKNESINHKYFCIYIWH